MPEEPGKREFDLEKRTRAFSKEAIDFVRRIGLDTVTTPLLKQFIRSATSIGANYCEADSAESRKDFEHKLGICAKESKESEYWLEMIEHSSPNERERAKLLQDEARQLRHIFIAIIKKSRDNG